MMFAMFLASSIIGLIIGFWHYSLNAKHIVKLQTEALAAQADELAIGVDGFIKDYRRALHNVVYSDAFEKFSISRNDLTLQAYLSREGYGFTLISVALDETKEDFVILNGKLDARRVPVAHSRMYELANANPDQVVLGESYYSLRTNSLVIPLAISKVDYFDRHHGFTQAEIDHRQLAAVVDRIGLKPGAFAAIQDRNGYLLYASDGFFPNSSLPPETVIDNRHFSLNDRVASKHIESAGWKVIVGKTAQAFEEPLNEIRDVSALVLLVYVVLASLVASVLAVAFARPVRSLTRKIRAISRKGDFSNRISSDAGGEVGMLADSFNDLLSVIEHSQQELQRSLQKERYASSSKTRFLSSMSHELRTPLNAIMGFAQLLALNEELPGKSRGFADEIFKASQHLLMLISDILNYAQIESGELKLNLQFIELDGVLDESIRMVGSIASEHNISIIPPDDSGIKIKTDRRYLKQILINFLSNAIKYNKDGGVVKLMVVPVEHVGLRISVTDTGVGIRQEDINALFEPFNRLGAEGGHVEGTGIGLTLNLQMAKALGGHIDVESQLNIGSTFTLLLPWDEPDQINEVDEADTDETTQVHESVS